jgi:hypothetical protein
LVNGVIECPKHTIIRVLALMIIATFLAGNISAAVAQLLHIPELPTYSPTRIVIDKEKVKSYDNLYHLGPKWLIRSSEDSINKYDKLTERAQIYGNLTDDYHNQLISDKDTLTCINSFLDNETDLSLCDQALTESITGDHIAGKDSSNGTLGLMQLSYLKVRGIL